MNKDTITNCLIGGAIGDALGAFWEFRSDCDRDGILAQWEGFQYGHHVTDDTQMMLFTLEACINHKKTGRDLNECCWSAYQRWLATQSEPFDIGKTAGGLLAERDLWVPRAPGATCLSALRRGIKGTMRPQVVPCFSDPPPKPSRHKTTWRPINDSKGCGGVMRVAPIAFVGNFEDGCKSAALTHGHKDGWLPAGVLCSMIRNLCEDGKRKTALLVADAAIGAYLRATRKSPHNGTSRLIRKAIEMFNLASRDVTELGQGWTGDEALAIGLLSALYGVQEGAMAGYAMAVAHPGDSDSTGLIAGVLMGAAGVELPPALVEQVEHGPLIKKMAAELAERIGQ